MKRLTGNALRIVHPVIAVQNLIAKVLEQAPVILVGTSLCLKRDNSTGIPSFVGCQCSGFYAKLADTVWRWNRTIACVPFRILNRVAVNKNAGSIDLPA